LLQKLFGEILIPQAVFDEAVTMGREDGGAKREVSSAPWVKVLAVRDKLAVDVLLDELDAGEAETIVLARELNADWTLMDERKGRRKLAQLGISRIGTIGILLEAKKAGFIAFVKPELELLRDRGFSISQSVIDSILNHANEA
jgi:predicted nucleic acid-binding protein